MVRRRLGLEAHERDTLEDAIRENALPIFVRDRNDWRQRDGEWFRAANIWWPHPLAQTFAGEGQQSCFKVMVRVADLDRLWPDLTLTPPADAPPEWWPTTDSQMLYWSALTPVQKEAENRLRAAGATISEKSLCRTFTVMWREAGRTCADESLEAMRRKARAAKKAK